MQVLRDSQGFEEGENPSMPTTTQLQTAKNGRSDDTNDRWFERARFLDDRLDMADVIFSWSKPVNSQSRRKAKLV